MYVGIIGSGYVGLVTGACFAEYGVMVSCVDIDENKIEKLNRYEIPFYEPGLKSLVERNVKAGRLRFSTNIKDTVRNSLVLFIAVGTPPNDDGSANLNYVKEAAVEIAHNLDGYKVIVTKSTVPVGTGKMLREIILNESNGNGKFDIVSNPEFLREGAAIKDFMHPDRVVIGAESDQALSIMKDLYRPLYLIETPFVITNIETAELIKYAANSFLATKISFINEMANLCECLNADVHDVARGMGLDGRIGKKFLHPGPGFGGSCFPKDTRAILSIAEQYGMKMNVISATIEANELQRRFMLKKILQRMEDVNGKSIAILGLSFKPDTDDVRDAPSLYLIGELLTKGAKIRAYDPEAMENVKRLYPDIYYGHNAYDVLDGADATIVITEWNQFRNLDVYNVKRLMHGITFFDLRNVYDPVKMRNVGFDYYSVGRL
ncbi:MAG: UDP-glucose/GDP-mannose dehydrogenase family protein [Nitrospirae bacterium]|nr:UDP-glucose/GDP-mannose dehydrogenase family protein [Nitrospirota bacterium]